MNSFAPETFNLALYDALLARGLRAGLGDRDGQMCVEAVICAALDLPHGDDPGCVSEAVWAYTIRLNDTEWSSPEARAKGLRNLGLAQLGSKGVVDDAVFVARLAERTIKEILPPILLELAALPTIAPAQRDSFKEDAEQCRSEGTASAALSVIDRAACVARWAADDSTYHAAWDVRQAANAAYQAALSTDWDQPATLANAARWGANAAGWAAKATYWLAKAAKAKADSDKPLEKSAEIALGILAELRSPGCSYDPQFS